MKIPVSGLLTPVVFWILCNSCVKKESNDFFTRDCTHAYVELSEANSELVTRALDYTTGVREIELTSLRLASCQPFNRSVAVKISLQKSLIDNYNLANQASLQELPSSAFSFESEEILIPAGQSTVPVKILFKASGIDLTKKYALGLTIREAGGGVLIRQSLKNSLIEISVKNPYDGIYSIKGYFTHTTNPGLTGPFTVPQWTLITSGSYSVDMIPGQPAFDQVSGNIVYFSSCLPRITVNSTTNACIITNQVANPLNMLGGITENRYDPDEKTFYLHYEFYFGTSRREVLDTCRFVKDR